MTKQQQRIAAVFGTDPWPYGLDDHNLKEVLVWAERYQLRHSSNGHCLHWLTQGRCDHNPCLWPSMQRSRSWMDQVSGWTRDGKPVLLLCQPYQLDTIDIRNVAEICAAWGVDGIVSGQGWCGYRTICIELWKTRSLARVRETGPDTRTLPV
jgi:hypothetical protein